MWDKPFDESMLDNPVIIYCPDKHLAQELMEILECNGVSWGLNESPTDAPKWGVHKEKTCYWVRDGVRLSYGSKETAEKDRYAEFTKCTFFGVDMPDFVPATDDELLAFLSTGG